MTTSPLHIPTPTIGTTLHNGATVLQARPVPRHTGRYLVLALYRAEFVTWWTDGVSCYWGHYFDADLGSALADFVTR